MKIFNSKVLIGIVSVLVLLFVGLPADSAPLAEYVPDNALVYIGWAGTNNLQAEYKQSNIKKIVDSSNIEQVFTKTFPQIITMLSRKNSISKRTTPALEKLGSTLLKHESAIYIATASAGERLPKLAVITRAGSDASKLMAQWKLLKQKLGFPIPAHVVKNNSGLVLFMAGMFTDGEKKILGLKHTKNRKLALALSKSKSFSDDIKNSVENPALVVRVNMARMWKLIESLHHMIHHISVGSVHTANMPPDPKQVIKNLGLAGITSITLGSGFSERGWKTALFVSVPRPHQGLLAAFNGRVENGAFDTVPKSSQYTKVFCFDFAKVLSTIGKTVEKTNPIGYQSYKKYMNKIDRYIGGSLVNEVLPQLGNKWAFYIDGNVGGTGTDSMVAVGFPDNALKAEQALNNIARALIKVCKRKYTLHAAQISLEKLQIDGKDVYHVSLPFVSPSWVVSNGRLYLGLYPQTALAASEYKGASILQNKSFNKLRMSSDNDNTSSLEFFDLPAMLNRSYSNILRLEGYLNSAKLFGIKVPALVVPPLTKLKPVVSPAMAAITTDSKGITFTLREPFAGSLLIALSNGDTIQQIMRAVVLSMAIAHTR